MFTTFIVKPLFNFLVFIYAIIPGHNFGLALIVFTILVRLALWPLVKKQLHQTKIMRKLQPEIKRIKAQTKGDKQKEMKLMGELYKEKGINPIGSLPILLVQLLILIGLNLGLRRIIQNPKNIISFSYSSVQHMSWIKHLSTNIHLFDNTLFGLVNLSKSAFGSKGIYWPALIIVTLSALSQYFISKQLMPSSGEKRSLREIMRDAGQGKQADQSEVNAAVGRSTIYILPVMIFVFTVDLASALSLYWLTSGLAAYLQQRAALKEDETEMDQLADKPSKQADNIPEAEVVASPTKPQNKQNSKKRQRRKKR